MSSQIANLANTNPEVVRRIIDVAEKLYDESGRTAFPTVDAVRRGAKVNMNDASAVMREWRREKTTAPAPLPVAVPETLAKAHESALAATWTAAQAIANENLAAAQAAWEVERGEDKKMLSELSQAFDAQGVELSNALSRLNELEAESVRLQQQSQLLIQQREADQAALQASQARLDEMQKRIDDLKTELSRAHTERDQLRGDLTTLRADAAKEIEALTEARRRLDDELSQSLQRERAQVETVARVNAEASQLSSRLADLQALHDKELQKHDIVRQRMEADLAEARRQVAEFSASAARADGELLALRRQVSEQQAVITSMAGAAGGKEPS